MSAPSQRLSPFGDTISLGRHVRLETAADAPVLVVRWFESHFLLLAEPPVANNFLYSVHRRANGPDAQKAAGASHIDATLHAKD